MITLTWGQKPPQFEKMNNGKVRIFYYSEKQTKEFVVVDEELNKEIIESYTSWICNVVENSDKRLITMLNENPNSLECQRRLLRERILAFDSSEHVNSFTIGGVNMWLDKATRVGLKLRFEAEIRMGKQETALWQDGVSYTLPLVGDTTAMDMLDGIELYASACYDVTQRHLAEASKLTKVEEIKTYDYISGYPQKLSF